MLTMFTAYALAARGVHHHINNMGKTSELPKFSTALTFLAYMVYYPTAHLNHLIDVFKNLPAEEKEKVKNAFNAVKEEMAEDIRTTL